MDAAPYKELLSRFCVQLCRLGDPGVGRITAKWLRDASVLDNSAQSRRDLVRLSDRVAKTAYALTVLAKERTVTPCEPGQVEELEAILKDLLAETDRLERESMRIDKIIADPGFKGIIGEKLTSIEFVMDYLQFRFGWSTLSTYNFPTLRKEESLLRKDGDGYRDALCDLIGRKVANISLRESECIDLAFECGTRIEISLRAQDCEYPESVEFSSPTGQLWVW